MNEQPHFDGDYFFKEKALTATAQVSEAFNLGRTNGGIRVRAWADGAIATANGKTITFKVETANEKTGEWTVAKTETFTAPGATVTGELFKFIPDTADKYIRLTVTGSEGTTGSFSAAPEYLPR